jgi:2'-hydroxyisoflavone reductase
MKILFIGGTRFFGRATAEMAIARGHEVTLFNRGQFDAAGVPGATLIQGDREKDLVRLAGPSWDAVVDTCGYLPRVVRASVEALRGRVKHYTFISSISVFDRPGSEGVDESGAVATVPDDQTETFAMEHYGALKARCEGVVRNEWGARSLIIRPGLVVGPRDYSDRFTYWVVRIARGGAVAVPDCREMPVQWIDARDLAEFILHGVESGLTGDFNVTGPATPMPLGEVFERVARALETQPEFVWVDPAVLTREKIEPWSDLPLVMAYDGSDDGHARTKVAKAIAHGLRFRSLEQTTRDVRDWWNGLEPRALKAGLTPEREAALLAAAVRT